MSDLSDMYTRYAKMAGFAVTQLSESPGQIVLRVTGPKVWAAFQYEGGRHVVQRIPPTERDGRRQTSVVSVAVLPIPPAHKTTPLKPADLEETFQTGKQKAGGQNVNRIKSAVRLKHKPTGIAVFINGRDQGQNRKEALDILTARVNQQEADKVQQVYRDKRERQMKGGSRIGGRGEKVRTYNFIQSRIVDHRLGRETSNIKEVMKGNLRLLIG